LLGRFFPRTNTVGHPDSAIAVPGKGQARDLLAQTFDSFQTFQVTHVVLRHGPSPSIYATEKRLGHEAENLTQFFAYDAQDFIVWQLENRLIPRAAQEAPNKGAVFGRAMRKLVVHEGGGQHTFAFAARYQETEAWRQ
jgi:hypothetical protein